MDTTGQNNSQTLTQGQNFMGGTVNFNTSTGQKLAPGQTTAIAPTIVPPTTAPQQILKLDTSSVPSNILGKTTTASDVLNYRNTLQDQYNAFQNSQSVLQNNAVNAGLYSPDYLNQLNLQRQQNQSYRQGTLDERGKVIPMEFQVGQQQQIDLQHALDSQATGENLNFLENQRQNNLQAAQALVGYGQQNYQNQFAQTQAAQQNDINVGQLGISQQQANTAAQNSGFGRYEYQQITDPTTGFPTVVTIDKTTGQAVGSYSPGQSNTQQQNGSTNTGTGLGTGAVNVFNTLGVQNDVPLSQAVQQYGASAIAAALVKNEGGSMPGVQNNPGNIKFAGLPGQIDSGIKAADGGTFASYATPQAGLQSIASIVQNAANGKSNAYGQSPTLGSFVGTYTNTAPKQQTKTATGGYDYNTILTSAPTLVANAIKPLPDGGAYIDSSLLAKPEYAVMANTYAKQAGIRVLNAADASTVNTIQQSITNLNQMASTFGNLAANSVAGKLGQTATNGLSKMFDTDYGSQLKAFQSDRDGLFQQIRALAGSSPRLNGQELNTAANAIPNLSGLGKDTLKDGVNKLVKTQSYLDNAIRTYVPDYPGTPVAINGQYAVLGSDGKTYTFKDSSTATQFLQADKRK